MEIREEDFRRLYSEMTVMSLAEHLGVKPNQVSKVAKELGLSKPRGRKSKKLIIVQENEGENNDKY